MSKEPYAPETLLDAIKRGEPLTEEEYQSIVGAVEEMDPNFFDGYPSDHAGPLTPSEKRDAVRDGLLVWLSQQ